MVWRVRLTLVAFAVVFALTVAAGLVGVLVPGVTWASGAFYFTGLVLVLLAVHRWGDRWTFGRPARRA